MSFSHIGFERGADGIAVLTINRPQKLNALNREVLGELGEALAECAQSTEIRGIIITGAGEKAFVAGADLAELGGLSAVELQEFSSFGQAVFQRLDSMGKPSLAAINGYALGGGLELAMSCTLRIASENARMGLPEVKLGLIPGYGATQRLPRLVGPARALELLLTGETVEAAEAQRIGLVNHVVPQAELLEFSRSLLLKILANAPVAIRAVMGIAAKGGELDLDSESIAFSLAGVTRDAQEGITAFLEKRKPVFTGK
jgi:enoyl-CoA hydratase